MTNRFLRPRKIHVFLLFIILTQGCVQAKLGVPRGLPTAQDIGQVATESINDSLPTPTIQIKNTPSPTATDVPPTQTALPKVTITAVKGNLFIRRGPALAYNPIGVLYKGTSTGVIARDVLSKWAQVLIPNSNEKGWISLQSEYSKLNGEFDSLPDFTFTDWPVAAYLYNCTEHDMYIMPGEILLTSYFSAPENQVWLNPGTYTVYDYTMPDMPEVRTVDIREGVNDAIVVDGSGEHHKCP